MDETQYFTNNKTDIPYSVSAVLEPITSRNGPYYMFYVTIRSPDWNDLLKLVNIYLDNDYVLDGDLFEETDDNDSIVYCQKVKN